MTSSNTNSLSLWSILEKDKLSRTNFLDWYRNLRIVLKHEWKLEVLETPFPEEPVTNASKAIRDAYSKYSDNSMDVACLILATMTPELQKQHEFMEAYEMIEHLKQLFQGQAR